MNIIKVEKPYSLKNDGKLEVIFLGTGTAFARVLFNNNFIIVKGDTHILVDFGITGPTALSSVLGVDITDIENILVTHSHSDHIGGIEFLTLFNRYVSQPLLNKPKLKMIISDEYAKALWKHSLSGGMERNESTDMIKKLQIEDYFDVINPTLITKEPRDIYRMNYQGIELEIFATNHIPDNADTIHQAFFSFGILVDNRVLFTCDTKFDKELLDYYSDKVEFIFHDCSFSLNPVHASLEDLNSLPDEYKSKMLLMHYGDNWKNYDVSSFKGLVKQGYRYIF